MKGYRWISSACSLLLVAGCASNPVHYHTLVPVPPDNRQVETVSSYHIEVEPVRVPPQVDRLELVIRRADGEVALSDADLWLAPLADEIRSAVAIELASRLRAQDAAVSGAMIRVRLQVDRFESVLARYALIEMTWSVESEGHPDAVTCRSHIYEGVGAGYAALVRGHQHAVASIADQIAAVAGRSGQQGTSSCPSE